MWCDICQQDVPAVARAANEPLCCPRCQHELGSTVAANPSDVGISLDSFDQPAADELAPPVDWLTDAETSERLREIDRTLSRTYRRDVASPVMTGMHDPRSHVPPASYTTTDVPLRSVARNAKSDAAAIRKPNRTSWVLSLLLAAGMVSFCSGVGILIWSSAFDLPGLWQAGLTLTIGAEGMLILSLAWMAIRLWRNGRQVNRQLRGVDRQLAEIEQVTGTIAGERQPSSQQFYHHFSQATSPHMLVANLQGQVDLMSARLASEGT